MIDPISDDVRKLLKMSYAELDQLFTGLPTGPIPDGPANGTAIIASGTEYTDEIAILIKIFAWQGKTFDSEKGLLVNRILPFGVDAIVAEVYKGESWFDQKECIVLDYSKTSIVAQRIRDEIRQIHESFYLGKVYWNNDPLIHFSLEFNPRYEGKKS